MGRIKRIWYLPPMRAAKVQASLRIRAVLPEPPLLAHTSSESRATFRQKARSLAPLNGWACAVKICHNGMLEDTNSLDGAQMSNINIDLLHAEVSYIINTSCHCTFFPMLPVLATFWNAKTLIFFFFFFISQLPIFVESYHPTYVHQCRAG